MKRFVGRLVVVGVLLSAFAVVEATTPAGAVVSCGVTAQRTTTPADGGAWDAVLSADGSVLVFISDANIAGLNPGHDQEVFRVAGGVTTKLTSNPEDVDIETPDISADGSRVVFSSRGDLDGSNEDGNEELFLWDEDEEVPFDVFAQITQTENGYSEHPHLSADGTLIVFDSDLDWDGGNGDGNQEIFLKPVGQGATQISPNTTSDDGAAKPAISGDGNVVVYESDQDPLGTNEDENVELFRYDAVEDTTTQITVTEASEEQDDWLGSYEPTLDGDGSTVVFETEVAHGSLNTDLGYEVMRWDDGTLTQVTEGNGTGASYGSSISTDGTRIAFTSEADLAAANGDGNEEIFFDDGGTTRQLTRTTGGETNNARITRNGNQIAFSSDGNYRGTNADGSYEVFVATCGSALKCDGKAVTVVVGQAPTTAGNDVILGTRGNDVVNGKGGKDLFCGLAGNDRFTGGPGNDRFLGDAGNDTANGDAGNDVLKGQAGNDTLRGGAGAQDVCDGGAGNRDISSGCEHRLNIP